MKYVGRIAFSVILATLSLSTIGCGRVMSAEDLPSASGYMVRRTTAYPGVVMVIGPNGSGLCTGTIVSEFAVLTASHCLLKAGTYTVKTGWGEFQTTNKQLAGTGDVEDTKDIALLIFDESIVTDASKQVYSLANSVKEGDAVSLVGAGCDDLETRKGAGVMREGSNKIAEKNADFLLLYSPRNTSAARGLTGDFNQTATCFGDSGGPMFLSNGKIAGVVHAGGSTSSLYISEFVNVADYAATRNWLMAKSNAYNLNIKF